MKTALKILLLLGMAGYLLFAVFTFATRKEEDQCQRVSIVIADSAQATLITAPDLEKMLHKFNLYPVGRPMKDVDALAIENRLKADPFIQQAICTKTPGANVRIHIVQRLPLLRVISDSGEDYYLDEKGVPMPARGYEADLAVVTGLVEKQFARKKLVSLGKFLRDNDFWNAQVQQIQVNANQEIDLVMRVSEQIVHLGEVQNFERKLRNLRAFYEKVLPQVGWHRYREISVAYENQVIGIK